MSAAELLRQRMSEISEECWAAGWLDGLEFSLWAKVIGDESQYGEWGLGYIPRDQLAELAALSAVADGWWEWRDPDGERFVPLAEWVKIYRKVRAVDG